MSSRRAGTRGAVWCSQTWRGRFSLSPSLSCNMSLHICVYILDIHIFFPVYYSTFTSLKKKSLSGLGETAAPRTSQFLREDEGLGPQHASHLQTGRPRAIPSLSGLDTQGPLFPCLPQPGSRLLGTALAQQLCSPVSANPTAPPRLVVPHPGRPEQKLFPGHCLLPPDQGPMLLL